MKLVGEMQVWSECSAAGEVHSEMRRPERKTVLEPCVHNPRLRKMNLTHRRRFQFRNTSMTAPMTPSLHGGCHRRGVRLGSIG